MISLWAIGLLAFTATLCCSTQAWQKPHCPQILCKRCPLYARYNANGCPTCSNCVGLVSNPCHYVKCAPPKVCQVDRKGQPSCVCARTCPLHFAPVCGSNGKTYTNECFLNIASCKYPKQKISKVKDEACDPCAFMSCPKGKFCQVDAKTNKPSCVCPSACIFLYSPVCGSNGKTYSNGCFLGIDACKYPKQNITKVKEGACESCEDVDCPGGKVCQSDRTTGTVFCACPRFCTLQHDPVCGSDGKIYSNGCFLSIASCLSNGNITKVGFDECGKPTDQKRQ